MTGLTSRASPLNGAAAGAAFGLAVGLWPGLAGAAADSSRDLVVADPRAFGHFIGDKLERNFDLTVPASHALVQESLPKLERATPWLELIDLTAQSVRVPGGTHVRIHLLYQIVNSPREPQLIALPAVDLSFAGPSPYAVHVDEWPITVAPLAGDAVRAGLPELRPARAPRLFDETATRQRLALFGAGAIALLVGAAVSSWTQRRRGRIEPPFGRALRIVRALTREPPSAARDAAALRAVHRAFDDTAGARVFAPQLDEWFTQHAEFCDGRAAAQRFFAASRTVFFDEHAAAEDGQLPQLLSFCAEFSRRERHGPRR